MSIEVKLELGHSGHLRSKVTEQGFTHDWTIYVRGADGHSIDCFVEKVVFHLHESFPRPKRVIKEPPYTVSESGYAGFMMPIDVYFRSKDEPKKVSFKYDLYLRLEPVPVKNLRVEKLIFQNPSDDFRSKLLKAGGVVGPLTGAASGSASLSTQACAPPSLQPTDDHQPPVQVPVKAPAAEKKPKAHVASKEIKSSQSQLPKPSQPFTDIFGAPIRTKSSPDSSSVKTKDSGHSSQVKTKNTSKSSSNSLSDKEGKSNPKESHKSKDTHHSSKESHHTNKETSHTAKDNHPPKDTICVAKDFLPAKDGHHTPKDSYTSKECHPPAKETHKIKEPHSKEGHKKENLHSKKDSKISKEPRPSKDHYSKDSKSSKFGKTDKELNKSGLKRAAPTDTHNSHGNAEKKKKPSPVPSENSDKSSSLSKSKVKEGKEKTEKQKVKSLNNSIKKEEEKPKHKISSATPECEAKEMPKAKPSTPKPFSPPISKPPSPPGKPPSPDSPSLDSGSDNESHKSFIKAHYSSPGSPASSISESPMQVGKPLDFMAVSNTDVLSPLSDEEPADEDLSPVRKRKLLSPVSDMDDSSHEFKPPDNRPMPKLNKKPHNHHESSKPKNDNFHRGNGSITSDISMHPSPSPDNQINAVNNTAYRKELIELQRKIMSSSDGKLLQGIVDVIEKNWEV